MGVSRYIDRYMDTWVYINAERQIDAYGQDRKIDRQIDAQMDGQIDIQMDQQLHEYILMRIGRWQKDTHGQGGQIYNQLVGSMDIFIYGLIHMCSALYE